MSLLHTIRRRSCGAVLLACALLALPAGACAADPPLRLRVDGNSLVLPTQLLTSSPDVDPARAVTLRPAGKDAGVAQRGGTSIGHLLELLGISTDAVERIEVQAGSGPTVSVSIAEVTDGFTGDPVCSACKASFDLSATDGVVRFVRPLREPGGSTDDLEPRPGQSLFVRLVRARTGQDLFAVNMKASTVFPRAGQRVRFSLTPYGAPADTKYTWYFGDGTTAEGPDASHRFEAGNWPTGVLATAAGRFATSGVVIQAKAPREEPSPAPRRTAAPTASPGSTSTPTAAGAASPGPTGAVGTGSAGTPAATALPASSPTTAPSPTATPAPVNPRLIPISGVLIGSPGQVVAVAGAPAPSDPARGSSPPSAEDPGDGSVVRSASSGILLLGVLAAGALTERRRAQRSPYP